MPAPDAHTGHLWIEEGEARETPLITVAPIAPIDKLYTFTAAPALADQVRVGQRVLVPLGRKATLRPAIVVKVETGTWTSTLKSVEQIIDPAGQLSDHLLELGEWIARYYVCPLGRTLAALIPQAARRQSGFETVRQVSLAVSGAELADLRLGAKQQAILDQLRIEGKPVEASDLLAEAGASRASLRSLIAQGLVREEVSKRPPTLAWDNAHVTEPGFDLNAHQTQALERVTGALDAEEFRALVLFGVSGSGKTEVYIQAMHRVLTAGRQAIMLVPEIALTTQLMQRLAARFARVAVIHSGLTDVERSLAWEEIRTGRTPVVIGTRSAVFAPCPNLGLIVVDEEQEPSYKNLQSPRFHVRDVAIKRAHLLGIPIILGSATPSLETWHNLQTLPAYERIDLPDRVRTLPLPSVRLLDMRGEGAPAASMCISGSLKREIEAALTARQQVVLLLNRRGYATWMFCSVCRRRIDCPRCKASMVLHLTQQRLLCHHCHHAIPIPTHCPDISCRGKLVRAGGGTERIEEQLRVEFAGARIHRADSDTMTHARKYRALVDAFSAGDIDILLGTQMIAKGLDFPNVALVGVIGADLTAALADFRASERLFQLVTQVAGRAGRAEATGRVVVQTNAPDTAALRCAVRHDFEAFAATELPQRKAFGFPPYTRLARFVLAGPNDGEISAAAAALVERLGETIAATHPHHASLLGPHPCAIERLRNQYRHEVLLRAASASVLLHVLDSARQTGVLKVRVKSLTVDVDPVALS